MMHDMARQAVRVVAALMVAVTVQADFTIEEKENASDIDRGDRFGFATAIDGPTAVIGAYLNADNGDGSGSAYIFEYGMNGWTETVKILAADAMEDDFFGSSVAISGNTAIIGAYGDNNRQGAAYIFTKNGGTWTEQAKLVASDGMNDDEFGFSVAISGDTAVVGAHFDDEGIEDERGSAYVFVRNGMTWSQQAKLAASDFREKDNFGQFVAIAGDTVMVGADMDDDEVNLQTNKGTVYVFDRNGSAWMERMKLNGSDTAQTHLFGYALSMTEDTALIGAYGAKDFGNNSGAAYVYVRNGDVWMEQSKLLASDGAALDFFGYAVGVTDEYALVGAFQDDDLGSKSGSAYLFERNGSVWNQTLKMLASDGAAIDNYGRALGISAMAAVIGAEGDDEFRAGSGSVYFYGTPMMASSASAGAVSSNASSAMMVAMSSSSSSMSSMMVSSSSVVSSSAGVAGSAV